MAKVELRNGKEILGMGGPWMGQLHIDGALVDAEVMAEPICDHLAQWCVYIAYRCPTRWRKDVRFWLHAYHFSRPSQGVLSCLDHRRVSPNLRRVCPLLLSGRPCGPEP
jgi:hypothetical protein